MNWRSNPWPMLLGVLITFWSIPTARAQDDTTCSTDTRAWVARADAAHPSSIRAVECAPGHVRLEIDIDGTSHLDVDVASPAGRAFRQIGHLGVSPILEVEDFKAVPIAQQQAFETLCTWLSAHEAEVLPPNQRDAPVVRQQPTVAKPRSIGDLWSRHAWAGLAILLCFIAAQSARKSTNSAQGVRDWFVITGLFVFSLLLRLFLGPFGPHHINGQGPLWIVGAASDATRLSSYGPGYPELFSYVCSLFPRHPDTAIFTCNAIFGALFAPLIFALSRKLGIERERAMLAATIVAIDAIAIRFGATEAYFPSIIAFTTIAPLLFLSAMNRWQKRQQFVAFFFAVVGSLVAVQAVRIHPVAWGPVALGPLFVLATSCSRENLSTLNDVVRRALSSAVFATLLVVVLLVTSGKVIAAVTSSVPRHLNTQSGMSNVVAWLIDHAFVTVLALAASFVLAKPRGLLFPALTALFAVAVTRETYGQNPVWIASYDRLWIAAPAIAVVSMIPKPMLGAKRAWGIVGAATILGIASGWSTINDRPTEQLEYAFFREQFAALPKGCRVVHVPRIEKRIVTLPEYAIDPPEPGRSGLIAVSSANEFRNLVQPGLCLRYAHTSICTSTNGRPVCDALERSARLVPLAQRDLPAKHTHVTSTYDRDVVSIGLFEVRAH